VRCVENSFLSSCTNRTLGCVQYINEGAHRSHFLDDGVHILEDKF